MNKVILCGYLGRDPELRYTQGGQAVANVSMATTERWKDDHGEQQERTEWHRLVVWGKQAEYVSNYLKKGSRVLVEGRIQTQQWEDKNKEKRYTTQIVVATITNLSNARQEDSGEEKGKPRHSVPREDPPRQSRYTEPQEEPDIPF